MDTLVFHGHSCVELVTGAGSRLLIDPFLAENPAADIGPEAVAEGLDYVLLSHGHFDHVADAWTLLPDGDATLISTFEICAYAEEKLGIDRVHPMGIGGSYTFPFGRVKLTAALHGGQVWGEGAEGYTTSPAGLLIELDETRVYFAGDTALTMDMQLLRGWVDVALLPIGDNFTMGPEDAARAVEMIEPEIVIPIHYNTWDVIRQDPDDFVHLVGDAADVQVLAAGDSLEF